MPIFVRAGALLTMAASDSDARLTEEPSRLLRYYPPPDGDIAVELPTGERRPLTLRPDRVPMFRR